MKRHLLAIFLTLCALIATERLSAQYYSWGVDPTSFRWKQMKTKEYRVVYPDTARGVAMRMMHYLDAVEKDISYGYRHPQMSIPFVVHPANFRSNGLVMWLPKRVEFLSTPDVNSYSMPWLKQLVAHEYRHAVQYNNLNRGIVKGLSYVIGQQSSTIGLLLMPLWMMEGDAVMIETAMSTYGRGLQPSFSMAYRAIGDVAGRYPNRDKWFSGSFRDYIPDHYALGYQMCRRGYERFHTILGDDVAALTSRRPYMVVSTSWTLNKLYSNSSKDIFSQSFPSMEKQHKKYDRLLKKYGSTSQKGLFMDTFTTLQEHWAKFAEVEPTTEYVEVPEPECYTTYSHPQPTADGRIIALKEDFDRPSAFVLINTVEHSERRITYTGDVSTRPALSSSGRLWWTEYRRSPLYAEKVASQLCYMDIEKGKPEIIRKRRNVLYPTPIREHGIAWVEYTYDGSYSVVVNGPLDLDRHTEIPYGKEVHGMAWDNLTDRLYLIITDDDGMHIARLTREGLERVTEPAYITLSDLTARDGKLYYGSIASGLDELHCYDLATSSEYQLSVSRYGSFDPVAVNDTLLLATTYDQRGYLPATQRITLEREVMPAKIPSRMVLPRVKDWDVVNLDTVRFTEATADSVARRTPPRRFSRVAHAFNVHSWAPASYDPYELMEESRIAFNLGATIMWQNILSTMEGFLTWGWNQHEGSVYKGTIRYNGLGVNLWLDGTYGGTQNIHTVYQYNAETGKLEYPEAPKLGKYFSIRGGATLPLLLQRGYHTSQLALTASWSFSNGMVANVDKISFAGGKITNFHTIGYSMGVHQLSTGITFSDQVRMSRRDFLPPWAITLSANYVLNPTTDDFGHLVVAYGKLYTPGFAKHHSLSVAASYQTSIGGFQSKAVLSSLAYKSTRLVPRGFSSYDISNDHYLATSVNYQLPIWYPDGGWEGVIYFKRLRLNVGADYASFRNRAFSKDEGDIINYRKRIGSVGIDLGVDFNLFALPNSATVSATFSLYRKMVYSPTKSGKMYFSFGLGLPF